MISKKDKIDWCEVMGWDGEQVDELRMTGYSYVRQGKYDIGLSFFKALVVLDPDNIYDKQMLGAIYLQLGKPKKAHKVLQDALSIEPGHVQTRMNYAKVLIELGHKKDGIDIAKDLRNHIDPEISNSAEALILAYG